MRVDLPPGVDHGTYRPRNLDHYPPYYVNIT